MTQRDVGVTRTGGTRPARAAALAIGMALALATWAGPVRASVASVDAGRSAVQATVALAAAPAVSDSTGPVAVPAATPRALRFYHSGNILWVISVLWGLAVPALILFTGLSARLRDAGWRLGRRWYWALVIYLALLLAVIWLLDLPLSYYAGYVRLHAYGLSTEHLGRWLRDGVLGLGLNAVTAAVVVWVPYALMRRTRRWWFYTGLLALPFIVLTTVIAPVVVDPLFNHFHKLQDPALEQRIVTEARRAGIRVDRIWVVDKSVETTAVNAYVTGLGGTQRIVLWDTLLRRLNDREVAAVVAHEIGHDVLGHVQRGIALAWVLSLVGLWLIDRLGRGLIPRFSERFGFDRFDDFASVPLVMLIAGVLGLIAVPGLLAFSRHLEHEADRFALELTHDNHALASAFVKLQSTNLSNPRPGPFYIFWRASHPPLAQRIAFANTYHPWLNGGRERYRRYIEPLPAPDTVRSGTTAPGGHGGLVRRLTRRRRGPLISGP